MRTAARDEDGHDEAVNGHDTRHDDGNERLHHNIRAESSDTGNGDAALGSAVSRAESCANKKKKGRAGIMSVMRPKREKIRRGKRKQY